MTGQIVVEILPSAPAGFRERLLVAISETVALDDLYYYRHDNKRDGTTLIEVTASERIAPVDITGDTYELLKSIAALKGMTISELIKTGARAMIDELAVDNDA